MTENHPRRARPTGRRADWNTVDEVPKGHPARALLTGATVWLAVQSDPRFSYGLYVPEQLERRRVVVVVHSTNRAAQLERDAWSGFAERNGVIVVTPLFPAAITGPHDIDSYKFLESEGVRFDLVLFDILEEVAARWGAETDHVLLAGHSGGAQFSLRMLLLHPQRLSAVAISAPGRITTLDAGAPWPTGIADTQARFDRVVDVRAIARVPVLLTVGSSDVLEDQLQAQADPAQARFGATRVARLETLRADFASHGIGTTVEIVAGAGHDKNPTRRIMQEFFTRHLADTSRTT